MVSLAGVSNIALNIFIMLVTVLFIGCILIAGVWFYLRFKRYSQYKCVIWGRDGFGQITEGVDKAGVFIDKKTGNKRLYLKKGNVGLQPDNIPYIQSGKDRIVYLLNTGLKNYKYIRPNFDIEHFTFEVGEEDVNWGVNAYERVKKSFGTSLLMQLLPFIAIAFTVIIILIMFIYFFKGFPQLVAMSANLKDAIIAGTQGCMGTTVIQ